MTDGKIPAGRYGVKFSGPMGKFLPTYWSRNCYTIREAVMWADTYLRENGLFYVLLEVIDHKGNEVEAVSVEN